MHTFQFFILLESYLASISYKFIGLIELIEIPQVFFKHGDIDEL